MEERQCCQSVGSANRLIPRIQERNNVYNRAFWSALSILVLYSGIFTFPYLKQVDCNSPARQFLTLCKIFTCSMLHYQGVYKSGISRKSGNSTDSWKAARKYWKSTEILQEGPEFFHFCRNLSEKFKVFHFFEFRQLKVHKKYWIFLIKRYWISWECTEKAL